MVRKVITSIVAVFVLTPAGVGVARADPRGGQPFPVTWG